jgi:hypothetical protein
MSIYSELLVGLCADLDPVRLPPGRGELVVILLQRRRPGRGREIVDERHGLAEELALELDHDRMLLRLCIAVGIETDPALFACPLSERKRLEALLGQAGVDFWTLDDDGQARVR